MAIDQQFSNYLHSRGHRLTQPRQIIFDMLNHIHAHLDAETLHKQLTEKGTHISLATIYRTLELFKELNLVQESNLGEEHNHFETIQEIPHYHFTCQNCGQVIEFDASPVRQAIQTQIEQRGLLVTYINFLMSGLCASCRPDSKNNS